MIDWSLTTDTQFCSVGPNHICFWDIDTLQGGIVKPKAGTFGVGSEKISQLCVSYGNGQNIYTGGINGNLYFWLNGSMKTNAQIHNGPIICVRYIKELHEGLPTIITGGSDKLVCFVDPVTLSSLRQIQLDSVPRSVDYAKFLLIGQRNGNILEYDITRNIKEVIMHSHHDGELWALTLIEERGVFITAADDNKLLMYDMETKKCIQRGWIDEPIDGQTAVLEAARAQAKSARSGGASTTSDEPPARQCRAVAWNLNLKHLAVATNSGSVTIREVTFGKGSDLNKIVTNLKVSKEWIECMSYNPEKTRLAVGSHDNSIYVFTCPAYE